MSYDAAKEEKEFDRIAQEALNLRVQFDKLVTKLYGYKVPPHRYPLLQINSPTPYKLIDSVHVLNKELAFHVNLFDLNKGGAEVLPSLEAKKQSAETVCIKLLETVEAAFSHVRTEQDQLAKRSKRPVKPIIDR